MAKGGRMRRAGGGHTEGAIECLKAFERLDELAEACARHVLVMGRLVLGVANAEGVHAREKSLEVGQLAQRLGGGGGTPRTSEKVSEAGGCCDYGETC